MKFSDETVEKAARKIVAASGYSSDSPAYDVCVKGACFDAKSALSSLTLQDLMQVDEVRKLVEAANWAKNVGELSGMIDLQGVLSGALAPFVEASND